MSEEKALTKTHLAMLWLGKNWFWVVLGLLIIAGCYLSATWLWNVFKGNKTEEEAKEQ